MQIESDSNDVGALIKMFCHQGVVLLGKIRRIRRCGLAKESVSLVYGFDISKTQTKPIMPSLSSQIRIQCSAVAPVSCVLT